MRPRSTARERPAQPRWGSASGADDRLTQRRAPAWAAVLGALCAVAPVAAQQTVGPRLNVRPVASMLERLVAHEMADKNIPAMSIALVDGDQIVWARGFGVAHPDDSAPATAETLYRIGSVSKVFTGVALMQLVEGGAVALDSPLTRYLDVRPSSRWTTPLTPRQLMSHRAGVVREPPVGGYADRSEPSLGASVASLHNTSLVYPPTAWFKYSNAGVSAAGYIVERQRAEPFGTAVRRHVLEPFGMHASGFELTPEVRDRLATGVTWSPQGRQAAPVFAFGIDPAVGMYSSVLDMGRFLVGVFADGVGPGGRVLSPESLRAMWRVQFAEPHARAGYGLGFAVSTLDGRRRVGHDGAVYGYATTLAFLPYERVGVAVTASLDLATGVTSRLADAALRGLMAARAGQPVPQTQLTRAVPPTMARRLAGRYRAMRRRVDLIERGGELFLAEGTLGLPQRIRLLGEALVVDDRTDFGTRFFPTGGGVGGAGRPQAPTDTAGALVVRRDTLYPQPLYRPAPTPDRWKGSVGEYRGPDSMTVLYAYERKGRLFVQLGWVFAAPLRESPNGALRFSGWELFAGEEVDFHYDAAGRATGVTVAGVEFRRHTFGPDVGRPLRITPQRPIPDLLRAARAATPPPEPGSFRQPDLVDVAALDSTLRLDIRYATSNNFLGGPVYPEPRVFLQRPVAQALVRAHRRLARHGYGLVVHDGYRPWHVTKLFWEATPAAQRWLVADPGRGSRHNRGSAVDVSLYDLATGHSADMGGTYDELTTRSSTYYPVPTALQQWRRELLRETLEAERFAQLPEEWWHFDFADWRRYPIMNAGLEELAARDTVAAAP